MTVVYSQRDLPLTVNPSNTDFSNNTRVAWDFTGVGALAEGVPWIYQGATPPTLVKTGTQTLSTLGGEPGRVASTTSNYDYNNTTDYGMQVGSGDFTLAVRFSTGSSLPATSNSRTLARISGTAGTALMVNLTENPAVGWYAVVTGSTSCPIGSAVTPMYFPVDTIGMIFVQRISGITRVYTANATTLSNAQLRYNPGAAATTNMDSTWAARMLANSSTATAITPALQSIKFWNVGLSTTVITAMGKDYWDSEANTAIADSITITSPVNSATIQTTSVISGTYTGTNPTGVEVQHGAGSWVAGTSMTIGGGSWTGTFVLPAGSANTLKAREANNTAIVSSDVTGIVVSAANSITFTSPHSTTSAKSFRVFQRNGSNQATVRVTGTYTGTPTSLEYNWGGSWITLVASPAGGVFDQTITLTGPAQNDLSVRFSNNTAVFSTLTAVGVGDVYMVMGQSNHVGGGDGSVYVPAVAPDGHSGWKASIYAKNGTWRENVETSVTPFSDTTGAVYAVQASSSTARASYFGRLATLCMAQNVPVAFVPCGMGSTTIESWAPSSATNTLYGAAVAVATAIGDHKAVLWWQGEANCSGTTNTTYQSLLNALVNDWYTRFSKKFIIMNLNATGNVAGTGGTGGSDTGFNAIHAAIESVGSSNANVLAVGDMNGSFTSSIHYSTTPEINAVALVAYNSINSVFNYDGQQGGGESVIGAVNDAKKTALNNLGRTGSISDMLNENVYWRDLAGGSTAPLNDVKKSVLRGLGKTGSLGDMEADYWKNL
jgi:hypothetical protein